jgi:hypothetical protein
VAIQQLYYTSCEHGVGGYAGFQFNALSQGISAKVMREVEQLTVYELPTWDSSPADAPVNLCHVPDAERGGAITANVVYAGADFSGRNGNYFAHALVTDAPERDFGALLPIELWESAVWSQTTAEDTTLPTIREAPPRGSVDRPTVAAFLRTQDDARTILARLLSAVDQVISSRRSLVLLSPTSTDNARWIAAVSYLLGDARAREMSFFTYTRRPAQCRAHVIGTVPSASTNPGALADGFRVFDMTSRTLPDVKTHPLAELVTQIGVVQAAGLWRHAVTLGSGTERSFDDWYPVASAAAVLLGVEPLPSGTIDVIAGWLPEAARRRVPLPAPHIETVLTVLLDRHEELSDGQLWRLLPMAKAAGAFGQLQRLEIILINRAIPLLEGGRPPHGPIPVATVEGIQLAMSTCERLLGSAAADIILTVLNWARESGLNPDQQLIERRARDVIGPALEGMDRDRRVIAVGQAYPAFASGLAAYLATAGPRTALRLLGGVAGDLLESSDLHNYPALRETLLIDQVRTAGLPPVQALRELIKLRPSAPPWRDEYLLASLWPRGLRTPAEAEELLWLLDGDIRQTPVLDLLDASLAAPHGIGDVTAWLQLCNQVMAHPVGPQLPRNTRSQLRALQGLGTTLAKAQRLVGDDDMSWYVGLHDRIEQLPREARDPLRQYLGWLTLGSPRPAGQLAECSGPVFDATCVQARICLSADPPDPALAARLFQSVYELRDYPVRAQRLEDEVLAPTVPFWSRRNRGHVEDKLKLQSHQSLIGKMVNAHSPGHREEERPDFVEDFRVWCKKMTRTGSPGIVGRISGRLRPRAD